MKFSFIPSIYNKMILNERQKNPDSILHWEFCVIFVAKIRTMATIVIDIDNRNNASKVMEAIRLRKMAERQLTRPNAMEAEKGFRNGRQHGETTIYNK